MELFFDIVEVGEVVRTPHDMPPGSVSCSEAFLNSSDWFSERLYAGLIMESSILDFEKDLFISYWSVLDPHRNVIED
jgi:hypothetical protein